MAHPVELGQDGPGIEHGSFIVEQKLPGKDYVGADGQAIAAATPENPYGKFWIGLNGSMSIHESNPASGQQDTRGSIRLGSQNPIGERWLTIALHTPAKVRT